MTTGGISRAKLQSNHHHQQTNTQFFYRPDAFLSPNQQCQSTEGKISHSMDLLTPSSPGGLPTLSLTTDSSWLPWGRVATLLISPLMPVPQFIRGTARRKRASLQSTAIFLCLNFFLKNGACANECLSNFITWYSLSSSQQATSITDIHRCTP